MTMIYTLASTISLTGTAADNVGVVVVRWNNTFGSSGDAIGTNNWQISAIPLLVGTNRITVKALDAAGNAAGKMIIVVRR